VPALPLEVYRVDPCHQAYIETFDDVVG
jgi:hypothetical protein